MKKKLAKHNISYFNPTLVQLESILKTAERAEKNKFQSHIGAIRMPFKTKQELFLEFISIHIGAIRIFSQMLERYPAKHFNPTLVQLEYEQKRAIEKQVVISIPHWCN